VDFISATSNDTQWIVGGMIGYLDTDVDFNASNSMTSMEGYTVGLYGTYVSKNLFVDGIIAGNFMDVNHQVPTLAAAPNNIFASEVSSVGAQIEGGFTLALGENAFIEPLASVAYVKTSFDDFTVPGAVIDYDDMTSLRGSLGARIGANHDFDTFSTKFTLTGRIWNEFDGENSLVIHSAGPDLPLTDDFGGSFGEVTGSVNVFSNEAAFSAFVNGGVKFKDDYQSTEASLGFRWRW
jgi:outer membrane autotransporter protein